MHMEFNLDSDDSDAGDILTTPTLGTIRRQLVGHCHRSSSLVYVTVLCGTRSLRSV